MSMIVIALVLAFLLGFLSIRPILTCTNKFETWSLSLMLGLGLMSFFMIFGIALGISMTQGRWIILYGGVFLILFFIPRRFCLKLHYFIEQPQQWNKVSKGLLCVLGLQTCYLFIKTCSLHFKHADALTTWIIKAKILYYGLIQGAPLSEIAANMKYSYQGHYPLLVPSIVTYLNVFLGAWHDFAFKFIFPLYAVMLLILFYSFLVRMRIEKNKAFIFTFFLGTIQFFVEHSAWAVSDIVFTSYYFVSFIFLLFFITFKKYHFLYLSLLFSIFTLWTKMEGIPSVILNIGILFLFMCHIFLKKKLVKFDIFNFFVYVFVCACFFKFYFYYKSLTGVPEERGAILSVFSRPFDQLLSDVLFIIRYHFKTFFGATNKWNISFYILLFYSVINYRKALKSPQVYLLACIFLNFCLNIIIYLLLPGNFREQMGMSINRLILHIIPFVLFYTALVSQEEA